MEKSNKNPWEDLLLDDYENHMRLENIRQLQALNNIIKEQLYRYDVRTVIILGIAGGNGLEHVDASRLEAVYGIDINQDYLDACRHRFSGLGDTLILEKMDLTDEGIVLPRADLLIADLIIEYIGIDPFVGGLRKTRPVFVSCVIQKNYDAAFVSDSPYTQAFSAISEMHRDVDEEKLIESMKASNYELIYKDEVFLPNSKSLVCLDFKLTP